MGTKHDRDHNPTEARRAQAGAEPVLKATPNLRRLTSAGGRFGGRGTVCGADRGRE